MITVDAVTSLYRLSNPRVRGNLKWRQTRWEYLPGIEVHSGKMMNLITSVWETDSSTDGTYLPSGCAVAGGDW